MPLSQGESVQNGASTSRRLPLRGSACAFAAVLVSALLIACGGDKPAAGPSDKKAADTPASGNTDVPVAGQTVEKSNLDGSALEFGISGVARGVDKDKNGSMDDILTGSWNGTLSYAGAPAPLAPGAKFHGSRM